MTRLLRRVLLPVTITLTATVAPAATVARARAAPTPAAGSRAAVDSISAVRAIEGFHAALARGDSAAVLAMLSPDVVVGESGDIERYDDYRAHHLAADISFAKAAPGSHTLVSALVEGNAAWATSTSIAQGRFNGRAVNSAGAELIVLTRARADAPWMIRAIHWSSHRRPA